MAGATDKALSYHDVLLRHEDVDLLRGLEWLNDQIIAFFFEYLSREKYRDAPVVFIPGSMAFLLTHCGRDEAAMLAEPLKLSEAEIIMFAVNDNPDIDRAAGGSHWSLLIYHRPSNTLRHYDSAAGCNRLVAKQLASVAAVTVGAASRPQLVHVPGAPQQSNCYDCGLYVLAVAELLTSWHAAGQDVVAKEQQLASVVTPECVSKLRDDVLALVEGMMAGGDAAGE